LAFSIKQKKKKKKEKKVKLRYFSDVTLGICIINSNSLINFGAFHYFLFCSFFKRQKLSNELAILCLFGTVVKSSCQVMIDA
jgi:hypothetical protein